MKRNQSTLNFPQSKSYKKYWKDPQYYPNPETFNNIQNFLSATSDHKLMQKNFNKRCFTIDVPQISTKQFLLLYQSVESKIKKLKGFKKNWSKDQINILVWIVDRYVEHNCLDYEQMTLSHWGNISPLLFGRLPLDCMFKFLSLQKHNLTQNPWTNFEEKLLQKLVLEKGQKWLEISKQLYVQNQCRIFRTGKQCRQHWICFMNPNLKKGYWTKEQDYNLLNTFLKVGRKWSQISKLLNGRNQNSIKNRFVFLVQNKNSKLQLQAQALNLKVEQLKKKLKIHLVDQQEHQTQEQDILKNNQNIQKQTSQQIKYNCKYQQKEIQQQQSKDTKQIFESNSVQFEKSDIFFEDVGAFLNLEQCNNKIF